MPIVFSRSVNNASRREYYAKCRALNHFRIKNKHNKFFIMLEHNCANVHSSTQLALQKSEPAGRIGDFENFFNGLANS